MSPPILDRLPCGPLFVIIMLWTGSSLFHLFDKVKLVAEAVPLAC